MDWIRRRASMLRLILEMKEAHRMNVILCSHLLRDVEETCDEVVILKDGSIVHQSDLEAERKLNRRFVELEVQGDDSQLGAALAAIGASGVCEGYGRWRIVLPAEVEIGALWQVASGERLLVRKLTHRRDTLEEIFLKAVGHLRATPGETGEAKTEVSTHGRL